MKLHTDTRGGMVVIGLFLASLAVGFLYYLMGIGGAVVQREVMQDAADAGAFSAAVLHARGMNIIVLINLVMACALAILIALKVVLTLMIAGITICVALAFWTAGGSLAPVPTMTNVARQANDLHNQLRDNVVFPFLRICHTAAGIVSYAVPPAATFRSVSISRSDAYRPYVEFGVPWPIGVGNQLPVEDDRFDVLCGHAGRVAGRIVAMPFDAIPGMPGAVSDLIADAMGGLAESFSQWFCGNSDGPPNFRYEVKVDLPESAAAQECQRDPSTCDRARAEMQASAPDATTGECPDPSTERGRACESRAAEARTACQTSDGENYVMRRVRMRRYFWRERVGERFVDRYTGDGRGAADDPRMQDEELSSQRITSEGRPCRLFGERWSTTPGTDLCGHEPPTDPGFGVTAPIGRDSATYVDYDSISHVYSCQVEREQEVPADGNRGFDPNSSQDMAPKRVANSVSGTDVHLGEDIFQIRFFAIGRARDERGERGVTIANWGRSLDRAGHLQALMLLSHVSMAQAEYYYPSSDLSDRADWMWHMRWRGRLRRFRMPAGGLTGMTEACGAVRADCGPLGELGRMGDAIAH